MALTKVGTDGIKDDAVTLAKQAAGTDGQVITYDASGNPVAVGPGTDGQVLTSTGAGSPPAFEDIPAAGATLTGSTNNTITTVTGANAIQGEANLTFDGNNLKVTAGTEGVSASIQLIADEGDDDADNWRLLSNASDNALTVSSSESTERLRIDSSGRVLINTTTEGDVSADDLTIATSGTTGITIRSGTSNTGNVYFSDATSGTGEFAGAVEYAHNGDSLRLHANGNERLRVQSDGDVKISDGDLVIGTSGHGIDFGAHGNAAGASSEVLDDYETGTWTIDGDTPNFNGFGSVDCHYSKVGRLVTISGTMVCNTNSSSTSFYVKFIPFAPDTKINIPVASPVSAADDGLFFFIDAGGTTGYLRNASYGIQNYGTFSNQTLYFTCSYVSNA